MSNRYTPEVDQFIQELHPDGRDVIQAARTIILDMNPEIEESMLWKVPFFSINGLLCYLNYTHPIGEIAFCKGEQLVANGISLIGSGKDVRKIYFRRGESLDSKSIQMVLKSAIEYNSKLLNPTEE